MASPFDVFFEPAAIEINEKRLQHLARLGLDLDRRRVLEVGAGIGLHTAFFEERGCDVLSSDGNPDNVAEMMRRYPKRKLCLLDMDEQTPLTDLGRFDIIYCYGTLYHLRDPARALARLAEICDGQILIETIVALGAHEELHYVAEPLTANQALLGIGSRPTRAWIMAALKRSFGFAYTTIDQPDFPDFETDWRLTRSGGNLRGVFVGSKIPLELPTLTSDLPDRHRNNRCVSRKAEPSRVWIDVGAYRGEHSRRAAIEDPTLLVHAFEPVPSLYRELSNGPSNHVVHAMAVAEKDGFAPFRLNSFIAASSLLPLDEVQSAAWIGGHLLNEERTIIVPTIRLDTFMTRAGIAAVEHLKIDAQGGDFAVVRSAGDRLRDIREIRLEVTVTKRQLYRGAATKEIIVDFLTERGFALCATESQTFAQEENLTFRRR